MPDAVHRTQKHRVLQRAGRRIDFPHVGVLHAPRARAHDELGALQGQRASSLGESHVVAHHNADLAEFGVEHREFVARTEIEALERPQVNLVKRPLHRAVGVDEHCAVVRNARKPMQKSDRSHDIHVVFASRFLQRAHRRAIDRLGQLGHARPDRIQMIARGKQLGKYHHVGACGGRLINHGQGASHARLHIAQHALELHKRKLHLRHGLPFNVAPNPGIHAMHKPPSQNGSAAHKATAELHMNERGSSDIQCPVSTIRHAFHYAALRLKAQAPHSPINGKRERQTAHSALQCR